MNSDKSQVGCVIDGGMHLKDKKEKQQKGTRLKIERKFISSSLHERCTLVISNRQNM